MNRIAAEISATQTETTQDHLASTLGLALSVFCLGLAIDANYGSYSRGGIIWLTVGAIMAGAAIGLPRIGRAEILARSTLKFALVIGILLEMSILLHQMSADTRVITGLLVTAALGALQAFLPGKLRWIVLAIMLGEFCVVSVIQFRSFEHGYPGIDVYVFQENAADALLHGKVTRPETLPILHGRNPYALRYPNIYPQRLAVKFYGPNVVDGNNYLTYGYPYPPLSLLMVLPSYAIWGDVRYAHVASMAIAAVLMALARPGRWGALAASLLLLTPMALYVIDNSWTEPLLALNFSIVMFCACRWRKMLPYALGIYFSTKQYTILTLPALILLVDGPDKWKDLVKLVFKAGLVVVALNLPFILWGPRDFIRAVVLWQLVQPFRFDALSYLVVIYNHNGGIRPPIWTPFLAIVPAMLFCVWRCARTPAGFAAAVMLIHLTFFAFNKQAFCNYYFFVMVVGCWVVAASRFPQDMTYERPRGSIRGGFPVIPAK